MRIEIDTSACCHPRSSLPELPTSSHTSLGLVRCAVLGELWPGFLRTSSGGVADQSSGWTLTRAGFFLRENEDPVCVLDGALVTRLRHVYSKRYSV